MPRWNGRGTVLRLVVLVSGEAGIGKSALVDAWSRSVEASTVVVRCQCDPLGRDLPLQPLIDGVARHVDALGPVASDLIGDGSPTLARLLGSEPGTIEPSGDPELGRAHLFTALLSVVERLGDGAVVVIVEDIHHAGTSTYEWMSFAMRRGHRLLVVATSRTSAQALAGAELLEVGPLSDEVATALVGDVDDARLAIEIVARSGGNPLFLLALAESPGGDLPASLREAVDRQADLLGPASETIRVAAIIGGEIDLDLLADVMAMPAVTVLADLESACHVGLLEERSSRFGFRHELVREALDSSAGSARRAMVHRDVARVMRDRTPGDPLGIAIHARLGGETTLAVESFVGAARAAYSRHDVDAALQHVDSALALAPDASAHAVRARVRMATLDLDGAEGDAAEAIALGGGSQALEVAAWVAYYRRRVRPGQGVRRRRRRCRDGAGDRAVVSRRRWARSSRCRRPGRGRGTTRTARVGMARWSRSGRRLACPRACSPGPADRRPRRCPTGVDRCRPVRAAVGRAARPLRPDHGARSARDASTRRSSDVIRSRMHDVVWARSVRVSKGSPPTARGGCFATSGAAPLPTRATSRPSPRMRSRPGCPRSG